MSAEMVGEPQDSPFSFRWTEFSTWFEEIKASQLEPARQTFVRILTAKLDREMSDFNRGRIRVTTSRVKSPARIWAKMTKEKYRGRLRSLASIPDIIDDLVGIRVICNNLSDVTHLQDILADLPSADAEGAHSLAIEPGSTKHYFENPKESGYRAYHLNLITTVPGLDGPARVSGELQVRTLLQDGWGELTHEDTYKPGVVLPELVTTIARRMADFLAAVDDLAQDLRNELDRLAENAVADEKPGEAEESAPATRTGPISSASQEALLDETRRIVESLTRPATLADIAQQVQSKFGTDIVQGWGGRGTFRNLLFAAVPHVRVVGVGPHADTVIPRGMPTGDVRIGMPVTGSEIPTLIRLLRSKDRNTPAVGQQKLDQMLHEVKEALSTDVWRALEIDPKEGLGMRDVNKLSRQVREAAAKKGEIISRPQLDYIFKALLWNQKLKADLGLDELRACLAEHFVARASALGIPVDPNDDARTVREWLGVEWR